MQQIQEVIYSDGFRRRQGRVTASRPLSHNYTGVSGILLMKYKTTTTKSQ